MIFRKKSVFLIGFSAVQNDIHIFTSIDKIAEFSAASLKLVPGIQKCSYCLLNHKSPFGDIFESSSTLAERLSLFSDYRKTDDIQLPFEKNLLILNVQTANFFFGYVLIVLDVPDKFEKFRPAVNNSINIVAITLENHVQYTRIKEYEQHLSFDLDITEREELQQSKSRLSRGESVSKSGNWEFHPETGHFIVSEGSASVFGIDKRRIDFPDIQQIILPEYHSDLKNSLDLLIRKEDPFDVEFKIRKSNSGEILDIHSIAEFDKKEKTVFGVIQDITVQKHAQEKMKRQSQNLSFLLEIGQTFASTLNMDILLQAIVERAVRLLNLDSGSNIPGQ